MIFSIDQRKDIPARIRIRGGGEKGKKGLEKRSRNRIGKRRSIMRIGVRKMGSGLERVSRIRIGGS